LSCMFYWKAYLCSVVSSFMRDRERRRNPQKATHYLSLPFPFVCTYFFHIPPNSEVGKGASNHDARLSAIDKGQRVDTLFHNLAFLARATCCACSLFVRTSCLWRRGQ